MLVKLLHLLGVIVVAVIVWVIIKMVLVALGIAVPAIILTLIGLLILIAVTIYAIKALGFDL